MVEKYSVLSTKQLGECLAKLLNDENSNKNYDYIYKDGNYYEEEKYYDKSDKKYVGYLIPKNVEQKVSSSLYLCQETNEINFQKLSSLVSKKCAIILTDSYEKEDSITYFKYDSNENQVYYRKLFNKHKFAVDFIDYVVQYRIDNKLESISSKELEMLRMEYISKEKTKY